MTEEKTGNFLRLGEQEYPIDSLTDRAKYLAKQIQTLQEKATKTQEELDQITVAHKGFTEMLQEELATPEEAE